MKGYVHSLQSLGTVDGPGVRAVVFASGCPLRCQFCHNPDTWHISDGTLTDSGELCARIKRLYPYIKDGGVTFSGGEPLLQAEFFSSLAEELHEMGLHVALDTSGALMNEGVKKLLSLCDLVLLDLKFTTDGEYRQRTGASLRDVLDFLAYLDEKNIPTWIRQVIIPDINDTKQSVLRLRELISPYKNVTRVELLPFRKLCLEKYEQMGIPFPLRDTPECTSEKIEELKKYLQ